jgi:PEGA domain
MILRALFSRLAMTGFFCPLFSLSLGCLAIIPPTHAETAPQNTAKTPGQVIPCALLTLEVSPSGATTLLNGRTLDQNVWLISLLPGIHTLEVRLAGFKPFARELDLAPGARMQLSVNLQKEP